MSQQEKKAATGKLETAVVGISFIPPVGYIYAAAE
jgi:hypothetical protein